MNTLLKKLKKLNIDHNSDFGKKLIKLDSVYQEINNIELQIKFLIDKKQQLIEDAEVMEMLLMYKFNKDSRTGKWKNGS